MIEIVQLGRETSVVDAAMRVTAEFVAFLEPGDDTDDEACRIVSDFLRKHRDVDVVYGDEVVDGTPFYKPAWSPERLRCQHYLTGLTVYRTAMLMAGVLDLIDDRADAHEQLHELALAVGERTSDVWHLAEVLCARDGSTRHRVNAAAVQRHFVRIGMPATVRLLDPPSTELGVGPGLAGFDPVMTGAAPLVTIVIPTGGSIRRVGGRDLVLVENALTSLESRTSYENHEVVVVVDHKSSDELKSRIVEVGGPRVRVVKDERPFNFAAAANLGAASASEDDSGTGVILLLNDDTEVIDPDWLDRLVALTALDDVGAVGAKLFYGDGRIQHAGVIGRRGTPDHTYHGYPGTENGHFDALRLTVNHLAATGACLAVRRDHWDAVGGMDERLPLNYNDVDLCLRLAAAGWRTVVDNDTTLMHLETSSRPMGSEQWEDTLFNELWPTALWDDPFDNPNFTAIAMEQLPKPAALHYLRRLVSDRWSEPARARRSNLIR